MESIPLEIIEKILTNPKLTLKDVLNFSATSLKNRDSVLGSSYIWKNIFHRKWPQFKKLFHSDFNQWFAETRQVHESGSLTRDILYTMTSRFYKRAHLSKCDFEEWDLLIEQLPRAYEYIVFKLISIINNSPRIETMEVVPIDTPGNETLQHYALKVLQHIRQVRLTVDWKNFLALPEHEQIVEKGAVIVAQWCQPAINVEWEDIAVQLDDLAKEAMMCVKVTHPNHPLHEVSLETFHKWKMENLKENHWNMTESQQIIDCLNVLLNEQHQFRIKHTEAKINDVLMRKKGPYGVLAIIYESIGRRLGLVCDLIENNNGDSFLSFIIGGSYNPRRRSISTVTKVIDSIPELSNRQVLELEHLLNPHNIDVIKHLLHLYCAMRIDAKPLEDSLLVLDTPVSRQLYNKHRLPCRRSRQIIRQVEPKGRPNTLKFAVGMLMMTRNDSACVIVDWETSGQQHLYHVLMEFLVAEDSSSMSAGCYDEELLEPLETPLFMYLIEDTGKHFSHFFKTHFVPNEEKEKEYPEDAKVRQMYHQKMLS